MTSISTLARFASLAAVFGFAAASAEATLANPGHAIKPLQAISFDFGSEHAVGYFLADNGTCKLVVTRAAAEPNWDDKFVTFSASRFEATVPAEKAIKYRATEGRLLEFFCEHGASAMSVTGIEEVAAGVQR
jgi:hypothetical protein